MWAYLGLWRVLKSWPSISQIHFTKQEFEGRIWRSLDIQIYYFYGTILNLMKTNVINALEKRWLCQPVLITVELWTRFFILEIGNNTFIFLLFLFCFCKWNIASLFLSCFMISIKNEKLHLFLYPSHTFLLLSNISWNCRARVNNGTSSSACYLTILASSSHLKPLHRGF